MTSSLFSRLAPASSDPIFAIAAEAKAAGAGVIDATVGMMLDETGEPFALPCVRDAFKELTRQYEKSDFAYPSLLGESAFRSATIRLIFGDQSQNVASIATTGGTGAVMLNLKLLKLLQISDIIMPVPTWPNHRRLISSLGFSVREVSYLKRGNPSIHAITEALSTASAPCALLLQVCGHNPTGKDFKTTQWQELTAFLRDKDHMILLDFAYQGLAQGIEEDAEPIRLLRSAGVPLLVAWSASKNHTIYGLRTGLACAVAGDSGQKDELEQHFKILTREVHSAAPVTGQQIVALVQERFQDQWRVELAGAQEDIHRKRARLLQAFPVWSPALEGTGLYTRLPLSSDQIAALKRAKVFLLDDGRINIAGISTGRMEEFIEKCKRSIAS
ncbi:hypothetical protein AUJ46_04775 [Candidatus Peregrinibacteria bacterium CG1_02_54_53]|nr:MAG: hypothetical protein AUJ46_04775 [Candidatus Peregrinibacteria bacterium CG1_02_54_53]